MLKISKMLQNVEEVEEKKYKYRKKNHLLAGILKTTLNSKHTYIQHTVHNIMFKEKINMLYNL
jgi:hypothetical protein